MESPSKEQHAADNLIVGNRNRINRLTYLVSSFAALIPIVVGVLLDIAFRLIDPATFELEQDGFAPFTLVAVILAFVYMVHIGIKRLHDIDASGWWMTLLFIPFVSFGLSVALYVFPGTKGPTSYGGIASRKLFYWIG